MKICGVICLENRNLNDVSIVNMMCEPASKNTKVEDFSENTQLPYSLRERRHVKLVVFISRI